MTYRQEMQRLAGAVATLLTDGATVPADDVRAALIGHVALVQLLTTVHRDLAPPALIGPKDTLQALEDDPVAVLGRALRAQPRTMDQPLTDVLGVQMASDAGTAWRDVAKAATVAEHHWRTALPHTRPVDAAAWTEMADVAALAQAVTVLDHDIADSLARAARWQDATAFRGAARSGLRLAAREVRTLAAAGPLPAALDLTPDPQRKVVPVLRPHDLPAALRRLSHLAATSTDISPAHVALACRAVAEASLTAADGFQHAADAISASPLRRQAAQLAQAAGHSRRVASLNPGDGQALQQAHQIHQQLVRMRELRQVPNLPLSRQLNAATVSAVVGLQQAADRQVTTGRWLMRASNDKEREWGLIRGSWEARELQRALAGVRVAPAHTASAPSAAQRPAATLDPALERRGPHPAIRPHLGPAVRRSR